MASEPFTLRFAPTPSEERLWQALRGRQLGVQFRRQVPIGRYIADFVAPRERLVVEVDGGYHAEHAHADARRDEALRRRVARAARPGRERPPDLPAVLGRIRAALHTRP